MSRKKSRDGGDRLPPFVPLFRETLKSPAWRQLSFAARSLFTALRMHCVKNNGHVYLSQRDAEEELGHKDRHDIANWFRELAHYGFIVQTEGASLGVDGKGKAPHWRITDTPTRDGNGQLHAATQDFLRWDGVLFEPHVRPSRRWSARKLAALQKQNPGGHVATTVGDTSPPVVGDTSPPPEDESGGHVPPISMHESGGHVPPISSLATGGSSWRLPVPTEPGAQAPRRQEPIVIDNHDGDDLGDLGDVGDGDELSEHGIIIEADGTFGWARDDHDPEHAPCAGAAGRYKPSELEGIAS
jgi:hypothetical protein